ETEGQADLLERLRPSTAGHDRLLIVPPTGDDDENAPTFTDYAAADWVLAAARPDLDPENHSGSRPVATGQELASPMAVLGVSTPAGAEVLDVDDFPGEPDDD